jgi:lipopolysaccharide transport system ATP-binding protein
MTIEFREESLGRLRGLSATAPGGAVIGVIGESNSGTSDLLALAAAKGCALVMTGAELARLDPIERVKLMGRLANLRRSGEVAFIASHEEDTLRILSDEIWWVHDGRLAAKGDPAEVLGKYRTHIAQRLRSSGEGARQELSPSMRRGDGRAEIVSLETLGAEGRPTMTWMSGEAVSVRIGVRFNAAVEDPVVGMMIRTRIGFEVYGTNTELEKLKLGPCAAGETLEVTFSFSCELCPQEYTLTAASHDPDGVWHDWLEDAIAFSVQDTRYTAGVANLRAVATFRRG